MNYKTLFVSPSVGIDKIVQLVNNGNIVTFWNLVDTKQISNNRTDINGTCHRVLVMNGTPYCVDGIYKDDSGIIQIVTNGTTYHVLFKPDVEITEHPNPSEWLNNVWVNQ